jgi:hypothetical protein
MEKKLGPKLSDEYARMDRDFKECVEPLFSTEPYYHISGMNIECRPDSVGHWVKREEHEKLRAELAACRAERDALREAIAKHHLDVWGEGPVEHPEDVALYAALKESEG